MRIFPASGNYNGTTLNNRGTNGRYWSSTYNSETNARNLNFNSETVNPTNNNNRRNGYTVRAVQHSVLDHLFLYSMKITRERLLQDLYIAFYDARRHKGKMSYVVKFEKDLKRNIENLCDDLMTRKYVAQPSKCFIVYKPKQREVFAAQFRDRIVHHLYYNYTHKLFERTFIADTYSCIPGRGTHYGIQRLTDNMRRESLNWHETAYVMKIDIRGYFMHIDRHRLLDIAISTLQRVASHHISKHNSETFGDIMDMDFICWMTQEIIMLDPATNCEIVGSENDWDGLDWNKSLFHTPEGRGLPIGNLTSQLFSNVYLNEFDQYMKRTLKCKRYGRYVDDAYVVSAEKEWLLSIVPQVREFLHQRLALDIHMGKLTITEIHHGVEFLGAFIKPYRTYISNQSFRRMKNSIKELPLDNHEKVQRSVSSFLGVLMHYSSYRIRREIFFKLDFLRIAPFNREMTKMFCR